MTGLVLLDAAGRRRAPGPLPGYHCDRPPRNKGLRYPSRSSHPPTLRTADEWQMNDT
jgi:hypothetical protein